MSTHYDIAIIGGGPAGSSSALTASKLGLKTILFEKKTYPHEKICGGALSSRCVPLLGDLARNAINSKMEKLHLFSPSFDSFSCNDIPGYFVTRAVFDEALAKDAKEAGATLMESFTVTSILLAPSGDYEISAGNPSDNLLITAKYVILATGLQNRSLFKQLDIPWNKEKDYLALCVCSETPIDNKIIDNCDFRPKSVAIFLGVVPNGYGWCFVKNGFINIGIGATAFLLKDIGPINAYKNFVTNLKEKGLIPPNLVLTKERPFPLPFKHTSDRTIFRRVLLVGDSAGFVSPVTGEGIFYSIKSGQLAAEAIFQHIKNNTPLSSYQDSWKKAFGNDLNSAGFFLHKNFYKSKRRMELVIALGKHDAKMSRLMNDMVLGVGSYRQITLKILLRLPVCLIKYFFKKTSSSERG